MKIIKEKSFYKIEANLGYHIRAINDVYVPEHEEEGQIIPEYFPYYSEIIYAPLNLTEEDIRTMYVEEKINA